MKSIFLIILLVLNSTFSAVFAQELYMPRNIKEAYKKGTRSTDGKPGKNYWQNNGKYNIDITINAETKTITGTETIVYTNNSKDTLRALVIRFVNNVHKPEAPRAGQVSADFLTAGLDITSFSVAGEKYNIKTKDWGTVGVVPLTKSILPNTSTEINIAWNYPLSKESGREGQIDSTTFYVAYSYPRISVYDDYNGWDVVPHTYRQEFYNDFNDYVFSVTVPKNYVVWGTGDLLNPEEVLQPGSVKRLSKSYISDEVVHIATAAEMKAGKVTKQSNFNTWRFSANNVSDVCFALSNDYIWDASTVIVDNKTKRRVSTQAAYSEKAADFRNSVAWSNKALSWYSKNWPGIAYPFSKMTAVQGFANMEYPMMVNDASNNDITESQRIQNHEIAHTYFPFFMGINETRYAFMDEGWATALEYLIGIEQIGKDAAVKRFQNNRVRKWIIDPSAEQDQPVISMSTQVSGAGYGNNSYGKAALSYLALKDMLGDEVFKKALHTYMANWNGKHPIPWDFFNSMNTGSGQNLNWFFRNWFFTNNYIDLAIEKVTDNSVLVNNTGGFAIPFDIIVEYTDGSKETLHQTPAIWKNDQKSAAITLKSGKAVVSVSLEGDIFMDSDPKDNTWKK